MHWIAELLLEMLELLWPAGDRHDRSVVGKSRIEEEVARFWRWVAIVVAVFAGLAWLFTRS